MMLECGQSCRASCDWLESRVNTTKHWGTRRVKCRLSDGVIFGMEDKIYDIPRYGVDSLGIVAKKAFSTH